MEYTQWAILLFIINTQWVLILVVMEYTQWEVAHDTNQCIQLVLILVVMEYTQWVSNAKYIVQVWNSLNPCCNGIYSMRACSWLYWTRWRVLILVVMEYTQWAQQHHYWLQVILCLNPCCNGIYSMRKDFVVKSLNGQGLNPCCNGIYSMRTKCILICKSPMS